MAEYERRPERSHRNSKRKRQTNLGDENEEWGCARADSEGRKNEVTKLKEKKKSVRTVNTKSPLRGGDRSWGEDSFLSPNRSGARAPALRREMRGNSTAPSNLGASSPSGNARGRMSEGESFSPALDKQQCPRQPNPNGSNTTI